MAEPPLDAERILRILASHDVDYLLIGGLAVQTHGHLRTTMDAGIMPGPDRANLERLARALIELKAQPLNPGSEGTEITAEMLPRATLWQFVTPDGAVDVARDVPGAVEYHEMKERSLAVQLGDIEIAVVSLDDLIRMKLASGRPVDLADVAALTKDP